MDKPATPKSPHPHPEPAYRLLLAEDDDEIRWSLVDLFTGRGFDVLSVPSGAELLDYIASSMLLEHNRPVPDVIVSDIRMPGFNGLSILEGLRDAGWPIPFILVTAFGDAETRERALLAGATAYFDKPLDLAKLEAAVMRAAESRRAKPVKRQA